MRDQSAVQTATLTSEKGGRVEKLWQYGERGEHNLSVVTVRNLSGTYTAYMDGMDKTSLGFDDRVNRFGYGDPPDSSKVKEIEYDPIKIRAEQIDPWQPSLRKWAISIYYLWKTTRSG